MFVIYMEKGYKYLCVNFFFFVSKEHVLNSRIFISRPLIPSELIKFFLKNTVDYWNLVMGLEKEIQSMMSVAFLSRVFINSNFYFYKCLGPCELMKESCLFITLSLFMFSHDKGRHKTDLLSIQSLFSLRAVSLPLIYTGTQSDIY